MKKLLTAIFAISITVPAFARTVTGTVLNENNEPMIGAPVRVAGNTNLGTTTDIDGNFTFSNVPDDKISLTVTYVGYEDKTVPVPSDNGTDLTLTIQMTLKSEMLAGVESIGCLPKDGHKQIYNIKTKECTLTKCKSARYKLTGQTQATKINNVSCTTDPDYQCDDDNTECKPITIGDACVDQDGADCTSDAPNAAVANYKWDDATQTLNCVITKCKEHFMLDNDKKCVASNGPCDRDQIAAIDHAKSDKLKDGTCHVTECDPGYEVLNDACVEISGKCKSLPRKAKSGTRAWDDKSQKEICIITECESGYRISDDKLSCQSKLSETESRARVDELRENAKKMHDKETSTANKLIGAAGIGATGIGTSQALSALSEQRADKSAEDDMRAYLATIKCDYGTGKTVNGGDTGIELPGGNELTQYATQYKTLAADLKVRKTALGMSPGIESETIIDAAETGLYDNAATGKTNGAFTSLSRALSDETSADAQAWAQQKADTASKLKTGAIVAGVGAVGSAIANLAVNSGADKQNKSDEILAKYASLYKLEREVAALPAAKIPTCPTGATGTYPDCVCPEGQTYNPNTKTCDTVTQPEEPQTDTAELQTKTTEIVSLTPAETIPETNTAVITLPNDQLFDIGKSTLKPDAQSVLEKFGTELNDHAWDKCTITIVGHTDPVGGKQVNQRLSDARAKAVKDAINTTNKSITFKTSGKASANCTCGLGDTKWTFPSDKASDKDYNQCKTRNYDTRITGGRYAPCRRVKITMDCSSSTTPTNSIVSVAAAAVTGATPQNTEKVDPKTDEQRTPAVTDNTNKTDETALDTNNTIVTNNNNETKSSQPLSDDAVRRAMSNFVSACENYSDNTGTTGMFFVNDRVKRYFGSPADLSQDAYCIFLKNTSNTATSGANDPQINKITTKTINDLDLNIDKLKTSIPDNKILSVDLSGKRCEKIFDNIHEKKNTAYQGQNISIGDGYTSCKFLVQDISRI